MTDRPYNFSAGPAILPERVITRAQAALQSLGDSGIGVLEQSHRSSEFTAVLEEAEAALRKLAAVPDSHRVLFLHGGASTQFFMVPMNLLPRDGAADYVETGVWSTRAMAEAARFGRVHVVWSGAATGFRSIPSAAELRWSAGAAYAHFTSNNTIYGTQWRHEPTPPPGVPLVCDASSDIFSRPIDVDRYGLLYAGAQKNLGPAGLSLVLIRTDLAERAPTELPIMLQYRTHIAHGSRYNTPPTFCIWVIGEVVKWLVDFGGLSAIADYNRAKADLLYDFLDNSALFAATADRDSRSLMNVCFRTPSPALDAELLAEAERRGLRGLKGHRAAGGLRASIYNAFPLEGCQALVELLGNFERRNG